MLARQRDEEGDIGMARAEPKGSEPDLHPAIRAIVERVGSLSAVDKIMLFGSRAGGQHDDRADIDLAVLCPRADLEEWTTIWDIVDEAPTLLSIDLVRLDEADEELRRAIEQQGVVLYERPHDRPGA